jgi:hypothetical protein
MVKNMTSDSEQDIITPVYTIPIINYIIDKEIFKWYVIGIVMLLLTWYFIDISQYINKQPRLIYILLGMIVFCILQMVSDSKQLKDNYKELSSITRVEQMSGIMIGAVILFFVFYKFPNNSKQIRLLLLLSILSLCAPNFYWVINQDNIHIYKLRIKKQIFLLYGVMIFALAIILIIIDTI